MERKRHLTLISGLDLRRKPAVDYTTDPVSIKPVGEVILFNSQNLVQSLRIALDARKATRRGK